MSMTLANSPLTVRRWRWAIFISAGIGLLGAQSDVGAAETVDPVAMSKTLIVLKVDTKDPLEVKTSFQKRPPTIVIAFPGQGVIGTLPERSRLGKGVIETITAHYDHPFLGMGGESRRYIRALRIVLAAPYAYNVRSEPGRVVIEVNHAASIHKAAVEVGLSGGTIIEGTGRIKVSDRFRAMQEALDGLTPIPSSFQEVEEGVGSSAIGSAGAMPSQATGILAEMARPSSERKPAAIGATAAAPAPIPSRASPRPSAWVLGVGAGLALIGLAGFWLAAKPEQLSRIIRRPRPISRTATRSPSGISLIDQLVWRAFERQGYQLIAETEPEQPLNGALRVMVKDGAKAALAFVGQGPFFEKQAVEQFIQAMRSHNVVQGFLVAAGSFTVPAQRLAKDHQITLVGREQLVELLSTGAGSEYFAKQLEQQQARVEETKETLRQYARELNTLRRQRNEASWYLGEERAHAAKLEGQLDELKQQLARSEADIRRWEQDSVALRKQWEENQWYLGEAQARIRHLETQVGSLQELASRTSAAESERDEANWFLGEERAKQEAINMQLAQLEKALADSANRERWLEESLNQLKREMGAIRVYGERRSAARAKVAQAFVEVRDSGEEPLFAGSPRNLSGSGIGLEMEHELPLLPSMSVRLILPDHEPIESKAQVRWQQIEEPSGRYQSGCQLVDISGSDRAFLEQLVEAPSHPSPPPASAAPEEGSTR